MASTTGWRDWLPDVAAPFSPEAGQRLTPSPVSPPSVAASVPVVPAPGSPGGGLAVRAVDRVAQLWVVGAHGGSGETTVVGLAEAWEPGGREWPQQPGGLPAAVLVCARTSASGLIAAQTVLRQWAEGGAGTAEVIGLVLLADAPGRAPKPLRELAGLVSGGAPRCWSIPWVEAWRMGDPHTPREAHRMIEELSDLPVLGS